MRTPKTPHKNEAKKLLRDLASKKKRKEKNETAPGGCFRSKGTRHGREERDGRATDVPWTKERARERERVPHFLHETSERGKRQNKGPHLMLSDLLLQAPLVQCCCFVKLKVGEFQPMTPHEQRQCIVRWSSISASIGRLAEIRAKICILNRASPSACWKQTQIHPLRPRYQLKCIMYRCVK